MKGLSAPAGEATTNEPDDSLTDLGRRSVLKGLTIAAGTALVPGLVSCAAQTTADHPVVETDAGKLRGANVNGVNVFKGVSYADTTAGVNRFMPPRPVQRWAGVKDATVFGASAPQQIESLSALDSWY